MNRKAITLPSGSKCVVRRMSAADLAINTGDIPVVTSDEPREGQKSMNPIPEREGEAKAEMKRNVNYMRIAVLNCCSPITTKDGKRLRIVDKPLDMLRDDEIVVDELPDNDALAIYKEVASLSGMGKEDAAVAATFPEEQKAPGAD